MASSNELVIERQALQNALSLAQGIVERRNTVPILGHVLLQPERNVLQISATDLEVGIQTGVACQSDGIGTITLNARKLFEIVREAEGADVLIHVLDNEWVEIRCGRARFKMMGLDPRSFPSLPGQPSADQANKSASVKADLTVRASVLADMIDRTIFAVSPDEARYNLSGVYVESPADGAVRMVATDGHRLAMIDREVKGFVMKGNAIIPRKGLAELRKLLSVKVEGKSKAASDEAGDNPAGDDQARLVLDGNSAKLRHGATEISMRLVEGEFPDYLGVIPKSAKRHISVGRDVMLAAIKRSAIFSSERYHGVKLELSGTVLTLSSTSPELGEASETLDVEIVRRGEGGAEAAGGGEQLTVGFNSSYLMQALSVVPEGAQVMLGLSDEASPGTLTTDVDSAFTYVVMPMRL